MAYAQYFFANFNNSEAIIGTCNSMCPEEETKLREKERLIHVLETENGVKKLVKAYCRSAADRTMAVPRLLRPYSVLKDTVDYLLLEVAKRTDVPTSIVYDFIDDRLRAVRQDITIQRLPSEQCCNLLEPMIRFYVYYGYILCELPVKDFDPVLNKKHLLECVKWYLSSSDSISEKDDVAGLFHWLNIKEKDGLRNDRILVERLYLLCNLDDVHPMLRYLKLKTKFKSSPRLLLAYNIAIANLKCNFITMCKLSKQLCPLAHCAFSLYLPILQRRALQVMSHAYNSKSLTVPVPVLRQWLRYENDAITIAACTHYGLQAQSNAIRLCKADFKEDVAILPPKKLLLHDEKLDLTANHVFTYKT